MTSTSTEILLERLHIQQLYAKSSYTLDANDADGFVTCFAEDTYVAISGLGDFNGHDGLRTMIEGSSKNRARHYFANLIFHEETGTTAKTQAYFLLFAKTGEHFASGAYHDQLVKIDGEWVFQRRDIVYAWKGPTYTHGR